jgi:hypothetical protein
VRSCCNQGISIVISSSVRIVGIRSKAEILQLFDIAIYRLMAMFVPILHNEKNIVFLVVFLFHHRLGWSGETLHSCVYGIEQIDTRRNARAGGGICGINGMIVIALYTILLKTYVAYRCVQVLNFIVIRLSKCS